MEKNGQNIELSIKKEHDKGKFKKRKSLILD